MLRLTLAFLLLAGIGGTAAAQGLGAYIPTPGPQPGFIQSPPIVGTFSPNVPPAAIVPAGGFGYRGVGTGFGGFGGGLYGGYYGYPYAPGYGYPYFGFDPGFSGYGFYNGPSPYQGPVYASPPLEGAGGTSVPLSNTMPARLTIRLPAAGEIWVNGAKQDKAGSEFIVSSNPLGRGESNSFVVKARWERNGTTYEADRTVTVTSGDRSTLTIVSGDPVPAGRTAASDP